MSPQRNRIALNDSGSFRDALRRGVLAPALALRRTTRDPALLRVQLSWAALTVASWTATVSLIVVAYQAGGSTAVALSVVARTLPGLAAGAVLSPALDRWSPRTVLGVSSAACAVATAVAALLSAGVVLATLLLTVMELAGACYRAAQSILMLTLADEAEDLTATNVLACAIEGLGAMAGPILATVLLDIRGPGLAFAVSSSLFALAALPDLPRGRRSEDEPPASPQQLRSAPHEPLRRLPGVALVYGLLFAQTFASAGLTVLSAALAVDVLGSELSAVGTFTSAVGLGGLVGSLGLFALAGSRRLGQLSIAALVLSTAPLVAIPLLSSLQPALLVLLVIGAGNMIFDVTHVTLLQRAVPRPLLGRAFGVVEAVVVIGIAAGSAVAAVLEEATGAGTALVLIAAPLLLGALLCLSPVRRLDARLTAPADQIALLRGVAPFALLRPLEVESLALQLRSVQAPAGTVIVRQGDPGSTYYVVDSGELEVSIDGTHVKTLHTGDDFGELALLLGGGRHATVTAVTDVGLWELDGSAFLTALGPRGRSAAAAAAAMYLGGA